MKYWLLTTEFPPVFGGGIGTYCDEWCRILKEKGEDVTVFIPNKSEKHFKKTARDGIRMIEFSPYLGNTASYLGYETMISHSFAVIVEIFMRQEGVPDWLESQEYNGIPYYVLQKKHLGYELFKELKVIVTCHCPSFFTFEHNHINTYQLPYFWIGEMERFSIKAADVCVAPSRYLVYQLQLHYPSLKRVFHVLPNPYSHKIGVIEPKEAGQEILFIGKLSPAKGILQTLKAFSRIWENGSQVPLKLVGDDQFYYHAVNSTMGSYIKKKYAHFIKAGLLRIAGVLHPHELQKAVKKAKFILVPSTIENLPYTVIECMAAQKTVLASLQGGQVELIEDGVNGFLFNHSVEGSYAEKLQHLLSLSNEDLNSVGEAAAIAVQKKCDPQTFYHHKMALLQSHGQNDSVEKVFPFVYELEKESPANTVKESSNGLLSVIIPFYNLGPYIDETIHSIRASSYSTIEIIIVNDGSTDVESCKALEKYRQQTGVRVIDQANKGLSNCRNRGAQEAKGDYIAFLDADDKVSENYYSLSINILKAKDNVHFVGCWVQYFENSNSVWPAFTPEPPYLLFHNLVNSSGLVYKRSSFLQAGWNDPDFVYGMEDYDSVLSMVAKGLGGVVLPEIHFYYRVRKNSMARGFNKSNMSYLYWLITQKHKKLYTIFAAEITNLLNVNGPGYIFENPTLDYHIHPGNNIYDRFIRKVKLKVKQQPILRKIALSIYKK